MSFLKRLFARPQIDWRWYPDPGFERWDGGGPEEEQQEEEDEFRNLRREAPSCSKKVLKEIIRGGNEGALMAALTNPAFGVEEVIMLLDRRRGGPKVLGSIGTGGWAQHPDVARMLVLEPKTPFFVTRALIHSVDDGTLNEVARSGGLPPGLIREARKRIERKKKRH